VISRARELSVWDDAGREYIDATASLWYVNLGHGRQEIADAVHRQLGELDSYNIFGDYANEPALELARRLADLAPTPGSKIVLGSGGGDMIDSAAKIARRYFAARGMPDRVHLISRTFGYHGTHGFGTAVAGIPANAVGFGPQVEDTSVVAHDDAQALEDEIVRVGPERVAAFFCEPVIGSGGVHIPPPGYIEAVGEICRRYGVLFIADCIICGFGRLGTWFGIDRWPVQPDLITLAKGLSNGALPIGALIVAPHVAEPFFTGEPGAPVLRHGPTYAGHPATCTAANVALEIYARDGLIERGRLLEEPLAGALKSLADHPMVAEVRAGFGFLAGIDLADDVLARDPRAVLRWQRACRESGVLVRPLLKGIAISPPLIATEDDVARIADLISDGLRRFANDAVGVGT
jgi:adenosylmethionine-8-amino-7-oxononanoate aminotransferase